MIFRRSVTNTWKNLRVALRGERADMEEVSNPNCVCVCLNMCKYMYIQFSSSNPRLLFQFFESDDTFANIGFGITIYTALFRLLKNRT